MELKTKIKKNKKAKKKWIFDNKREYDNNLLEEKGSVLPHIFYKFCNEGNP